MPNLWKMLNDGYIMVYDGYIICIYIKKNDDDDSDNNMLMMMIYDQHGYIYIIIYICMQ